MRKWFLYAALVCCLLFTGCDAGELSSLQEISMPYAGEYQCQRLTLGEKDVLPLFEKLTLTLERGGTFTLTYQKKHGGAGGLSGTYSLDCEQNTIAFTPDGGETRVFPYQDGSIFFEVPILGRLLFAQFSPNA